jgi:hypothetical protein
MKKVDLSDNLASGVGGEMEAPAEMTSREMKNRSFAGKMNDVAVAGCCMTSCFTNPCGPAYSVRRNCDTYFAVLTI